MTNNNIISNLENLNDEALDGIIEQIENIKKNRRESECYKIVGELNELLVSISNILKRAEVNSCVLGECQFLINNTFILRECDGEMCSIDLEYC